jgi:hypothetical protein
MQPNERHTVYAASGRPYRLPIDAVQFRSLLLYVDEMCALHGCDNTLTHAHTWARAHGVPWSSLSGSLRSLGGFCDCEVGMNVAESDWNHDPDGDE